MAIKNGDKVRFLHEKGEGIVKNVISAYKVVVELSEGLDIEVKMSEIVPVASIKLHDITTHAKDHSVSKRVHHSKPHADTVKVIDLHFEKISDNSVLRDSQKLRMQLDYFEHELEKAFRGHLKKIVFVHGVGNGVLRQAIRDILKGYEGIAYSDASYRNYGAGATEVRIISRNNVR